MPRGLSSNVRCRRGERLILISYYFMRFRDKAGSKSLPPGPLYALGSFFQIAMAVALGQENRPRPPRKEHCNLPNTFFMLLCNLIIAHNFPRSSPNYAQPCTNWVRLSRLPLAGTGRHSRLPNEPGRCIAAIRTPVTCTGKGRSARYRESSCAVHTARPGQPARSARPVRGR
jgi:hypothetical protein